MFWFRANLFNFEKNISYGKSGNGAGEKIRKGKVSSGKNNAIWFEGWGNANEDSDWDFLVIMPEDNISFEKETEISREFYKIEIDTGESISPYIIRQSYWISKANVSPLFLNVKKEGIVLQ